MIRHTKDTYYNGVPLVRHSTSFACDECETRCDPNSCNPEDWLYRYNGQQICWYCLMSQTGAEIITE